MLLGFPGLPTSCLIDGSLCWPLQEMLELQAKLLSLSPVQVMRGAVSMGWRAACCPLDPV